MIQRIMVISVMCLAAAAPAQAEVARQHQEPAWSGEATYRLLVRVEARDIGERDRDEGPAELKLDAAAILKEHFDLDGRIDLQSVQVMRYDPATGKTFDDGGWAYGRSPADRPFRWYDDAIPYELPVMETNLSATDGELRWTPRMRWGYFYDLVGDWKSGRLAWMHTQEGSEPSYYAIYFDVLPPDVVPWRAEPRGWIGDGMHRTTREASYSTGLIHTRIDLIDWDGDGLIDIIAGSAMGTILWYRNIGTPEAPEFGSARMLFTEDGKPMDVGWSSSPKVVDWTGNGPLDIVTGAERNRLAWFENIGTNEDKRFVYRGLVRTTDGQPLALPTTPVQGGQLADGTNVYELDYYPVLDVVDFDGNGRLDLLAGGYITGRVYLYRNVGRGDGPPELEFAGPIEADGKPIDVGWAAAALAYDVNGNGLFDLIVGNMKVTEGGGDSASDEYFLHYYENIGEPGRPRFTERRLPREGQFPRASLGTPRAADMNNNGLADLVVSSNTSIYIFENIGTATRPRWRAHTDRLTSAWGNAPLSATQLLDWNGNDLLDQVNYYNVALNTGAGNPGLFGPSRSVLPPGQVIDHRSHIGDDWVVGKRLFDLDGDGLVDALDADHTGHLWFHRNIGTADAPSFDAEGQRVMQTDGEPIWVGPDETAAPFDVLQGSRALFAVGDLNGNGRPDVVMTNYIGVVRVYEQHKPRGEALLFTEPRIVADIRVRCAPSITDWTGDGRLDIIVAATADRFMLIRNLGPDDDGQAQFAPGEWIDLPGAPYGAGGAIIIADFNGDGDDDIIVRTAYGYSVWVERTFLEHGYAAAAVVDVQRTADEHSVQRRRLGPFDERLTCAAPALAQTRGLIVGDVIDATAIEEALGRRPGKEEAKIEASVAARE